MFIKKNEANISNDNYANGFGLARPNTLKSFENVPGSEASDWAMLKEREIARFNELAAKAFGNPTITNAGIVLDGSSLTAEGYGEAIKTPMKKDIQGGMSK